jgi:hypothetical protein
MIKEGLLFHIPAKEGKSIRARRNHKKVQKNYCIARTIFSLDNLQILQITLKNWKHVGIKNQPIMYRVQLTAQCLPQ